MNGALLCKVLIVAFSFALGVVSDRIRAVSRIKTRRLANDGQSKGDRS